jgi:hypothetical protein
MVIMQFEIRGVRYADENEAKKILEGLYTSGNDEIYVTSSTIPQTEDFIAFNLGLIS